MAPVTGAPCEVEPPVPFNNQPSCVHAGRWDRRQPTLPRRPQPTARRLPTQTEPAERRSPQQVAGYQCAGKLQRNVPAQRVSLGEGDGSIDGPTIRRDQGVVAGAIADEQVQVAPPFCVADAAAFGAPREALEGKNRFKWRKGTRVQPYALWRLSRSWGSVILCEGKSDAQTFWHHGVPALGVPGASNWQAAWSKHVEGLVGEDRAAKLLFLAGVSRLLQRPVSCVVKGASNSGKSVTVETVFAHFPPSAFYALSSMSARSLAYSDEPLAHRILILYEAAGMASDLATYLMRSLLSGGKIRYETVENPSQGSRPSSSSARGPPG
jgi:hypothetical protein